MAKELCYIGDPSYVIGKWEWGRMIKEKRVYSNAELGGEQFFMRETYSGDGVYKLMDGSEVGNEILQQELSVDSGTLAAIPLRILPPTSQLHFEDDTSTLGAVVEIDLMNCSEEEGRFTFDHYTVDTNPNVDIEVPESLTVYYTCSNSISVEELEKKLECSWGDIKNWWIKYDTFYAQVRNEGEPLTAELDSGWAVDHIDWKWPDRVRVYDKDFNCIEERD